MTNSKELRILMLEDSEDDINLIERVLKKNNLLFVSKHVDTRDEFNESMLSFQPDVVLSDHGLPQFNSLEALKIVINQRQRIPFIIVTGTMSDEFAVSCLHQGADDYLLKSNLSRLPQAIRRVVKERRLETLKREARHALRKQNSELSKVNKELDSLVYSVSHNLRGPLASVMGLLNLARMEDLNGNLEKVHGLMDKSISKLDDTLKEILDYSRNARNEVQSDVIDWWQTFEEVMIRLEHLPNFDHVSILKDFPTNHEFYTDGYRLRAILVNLLSNAINYRDQRKESVIHLDVRPWETGVVITIKDNGIGISEEVCPKIFDMFYRGSQGSAGSGLGLYITREIVRKLHGEIIVTSKEGVETIVIVRIPQFRPQ